MPGIESLERRARMIKAEWEKDSIDILYDNGFRRKIDIGLAMDIASTPGAPRIVEIYGQQGDRLCRALQFYEQTSRNKATSVTHALAEEYTEQLENSQTE